MLKAQFAAQFEQYDLLLSPTMATTAFPVGEPPETIDGKAVHWFSGYTPFTYPINMIGHTAASVPCGLSADGLPIGLHVVGRFGDESTVIAAFGGIRGGAAVGGRAAGGVVVLGG